ncbi:hypothetical protein D3C77_726110 [compost metagenome]
MAASNTQAFFRYRDALNIPIAGFQLHPAQHHVLPKRPELFGMRGGATGYGWYDSQGVISRCQPKRATRR